VGVSELARVEHDNVGLEIPETHSLALLGLFHPSRDRKASTMRRSIMLASAASLAVALSAPAHSQGAPQTVTLMKVDPQTLATGYRTSKVIGATVVNEVDETVTGGALEETGVTQVTEETVNGVAGPESPVGKVVDETVGAVEGILGGK